ncbi:MAG: S-layer homology domain-containing protein [Clostridia bacterium]|nr:S-layer homology domain-containing protein [Clostridia bacterium]
MKRFLSVICMMMLVLALPFAASAAQPAYLSAEEWAVLSLTNQQRAKANLKPLSVFDELQGAADLRATEIETLFSHTRPNGEQCFTALDLYDIDYYSAGENIAAGYRSPAEVMDGWMNSEGHRGNILDSDYKHMACGYYVKDGSYYYTHWAQFFVGGCTTTAVNIVGEAPRFDRSGKLVSTDAMLSVSCDLHGTSYVALKDVSYYCRPNQYGSATFTVSYDGVSKSLPCTVGFSDIPAGAWYQSAVEYVVDAGLMNGMETTLFAPEATMTRAQLVTVLYRMEGSPAPQADGGFTDVVEGAWFADAVNWAAEEEIVNGIGDNRFDPNAPITRAQLATILLRFDRRQNPSEPELAGLESFADGDAAPAWAKTAVQWAVHEGLINGVSKNNAVYVDFNGRATRAQVATILMRYIEN